MAKRRFERPDSPAVAEAEAAPEVPAIPWRSSTDDVPMGVGLRAMARNTLGKALRWERSRAEEIVALCGEAELRAIVRLQLDDDPRAALREIVARVTGART